MTDQLELVREFYSQSDRDYLRYWSGKRALALHFGYFDESTTSHEQSLLKMNEVLSEIANVSSDDKLLDAGCGYGGTSLWFAENRMCDTTGVNIVADHLEIARRASNRSAQAARAKFVQADYTALPFDDGSFTVIVGVESIVHCTDRARFIEEAFRVLAPGGRLLIAEYMLSGTHQRTADQEMRLQKFSEGWAMPALLSPPQYQELLAMAGFEPATFTDLTNNVEPSVRKCKRNAQLVSPFVKPLARLGLITPRRRDYTFANIYIHQLLRENVWRYQVLTACKPQKC